MTEFPREWTIGAAGHGVGSPSLTRNRPDRCARYKHPGVTYNPWADETWCLCGDRRVPGNHVDWDFKGSDHPLMERRDENGEWAA